MSQNVTPALQDAHDKWAITIKNKKIIVRAKTFLKPLQSVGLEIKSGFKNTYLKITNEDV